MQSTVVPENVEVYKSLASTFSDVFPSHLLGLLD